MKTGPGKRKRLEPVEGIEGEEEPAVGSDFEVAETQPAGAVARRDLGVHGMPVARRFPRGPDLLGGRLADREEAIPIHRSSLPRVTTRVGSKGLPCDNRLP